MLWIGALDFYLDPFLLRFLSGRFAFECPLEATCVSLTVAHVQDA